MINTNSIFLLHDKNNSSGTECVNLQLNMPELSNIKIGFIPGPGDLTELVLMVRELTELIISRRISELSDRGMKIACQKGCHAACCHYLISVSVPEALTMVAETAALPTDERNHIMNSCRRTSKQIQFQMAQANIAGTGKVTRNNLLTWYRELNVSCPLLENNCCSIYKHRPIVCRECLAVGSPDQCRVDTQVQTHVRLPIHPANILMQLTQQFFNAAPGIIAIPAVFDWFDENGHIYKKNLPRSVLVQKFVQIATNQ
jgi:Fe-S-cluster containining protein